MTSNGKLYSLSRLKQELITNTDGTTSGTFDEIFDNTNTNGNQWEISVGMMEVPVLLVSYELIDDDRIIIDYADDNVELGEY